MNNAPERIWIDEDDWGDFPLKGAIEYIRADLVQELVDKVFDLPDDEGTFSLFLKASELKPTPPKVSPEES